MNQNLELQSKENLSLLVTHNEVSLLNEQGVCVSSSCPEKIGQEVLKPFELDRIRKSKITKNANLTNNLVIIPEHELFSTENTGSLNKLAELVAMEYLNRDLTRTSLEQFLVNLILYHGKTNNLKDHQAIATSLGLNLETKKVAIVIMARSFNRDLAKFTGDLTPEDLITNYKEKLLNAFKSFFTRNQEMFIIHLGHGKFVIFKTVFEDEEKGFRKNLLNAYEAIFEPLKKHEKENLLIGFGNAYRDIDGIIEAYREADQALIFGQKINPAKKVYYFSELDEVRIFFEENITKKVIYANEILGKLKSKELRRTLEVFFSENLNLTASATKLKVHPNTVVYRLNRIKEIIGLDPRVFEDAAKIRIALLTIRFLT